MTWTQDPAAKSNATVISCLFFTGGFRGMTVTYPDCLTSFLRWFHFKDKMFLKSWVENCKCVLGFGQLANLHAMHTRISKAQRIAWWHILTMTDKHTSWYKESGISQRILARWYDVSALEAVWGSVKIQGVSETGTFRCSCTRCSPTAADFLLLLDCKRSSKPSPLLCLEILMESGLDVSLSNVRTSPGVILMWSHKSWNCPCNPCDI